MKNLRLFKVLTLVALAGRAIFVQKSRSMQRQDRRTYSSITCSQQDDQRMMDFIC